MNGDSLPSFIPNDLDNCAVGVAVVVHDAFRTARPISMVAIVLLNVVSRIKLPGVRFLPIRFTPTFDKWVGESCGGVSLHVTDRTAFRPYRTTVAIIDAVRRLWPKDFAWRLPPYEYETVKPPTDIISGSNRLRERVGQGEALSHDDWLSLTVADERAWWERARPYCLYEAGR